MGTADAVWHRAIDLGLDQEDPGPGDIAVTAVALTHGYVMNSGVLGAVFDALSSEQLDAAEHGYRWLGLEAVTDLLVATRAAVDGGGLSDDELHALDVSSDEAYREAVPTDSYLIDEVVQRRYDEDPSAFARP